jgi:sugar O-acyltransferase (sialic acid O-acetyltransferase NeuD family)
MKNTLVIIGAGGHGKVVLETALLQGDYQIAGFIDDAVRVDEINGFLRIGTIDELLNQKIKADCFIVAIGNNETRKNLFEKLKSFMKPAIIKHPSAVISVSASIGNGTVILANSVINAGTSIGENCIINSMCLIDHETEIGNHVHISQGTIVGSNVKICDSFSTTIGDKIDSFSNC